MTLQPSAATPAQQQQQVAVSVDVGADFVVGKLSSKALGPFEVLLEPFEGGHLPTSTGLEEAIRRRAGEAKPPLVVRGLSVGVRGYRPASGPVDGVLMVVEGSL